MKFPALLIVFVLLLSACTPSRPAASPAAVSPPPSPVPTLSANPGAPSPSPSPLSAPSPEPEPEPEPEPHDYTLPVPACDPVDDEWFADAVLIGDSRTDGMHKFSGLKPPTYLYYTGLTVFDFSTRAVIPLGGAGRTAEEALRMLAPEKVYLSLGLNELGWHDDNAYYTEYGAVVDLVREVHPKAQIYLQLLIPVNAGKCKANNQPYYVTNEQIDKYNVIIRQVAAEKEVFLLDLPEVFADENGELPREMTGDGVHMTKAGYALWADYLRTHVVPEEETVS